MRRLGAQNGLFLGREFMHARHLDGVVLHQVGALPAVINAVMDALAPLGVRELDMPASSERVWQAIQAAKRDRI